MRNRIKLSENKDELVIKKLEALVEQLKPTANTGDKILWAKIHNHTLYQLDMLSRMQKVLKVTPRIQKNIILVNFMESYFITCFSQIEFNIKYTLLKYPVKNLENLISKFRNKKYLTMSEIIKKLAENKIIANEDKPIWIQANYLRNIMIHNASFPDKTETLYFDEGYDVNLIENKTMDFPGDFFYYLALKLIQLFQKLEVDLIHDSV